jgi:hypothetical protein
MNELDLIRSFRADVPPPTATAIATAERAWRRPGRRRPSGMIRWGLPASLAAAATVAALALTTGDDGRLGTPDASAAQTLRLAASAQHGGVTRPLRAGEYWYVRRRITFGGRPEVREDWVAPDGARRWRLGSGEEHSVDPTKRPPFHIGDSAVTYSQLLALPRDPRALYARIRAAAVECECGQSVDQETFTIAADLLRDNPIPVDLRSALLRAAALVPGIELDPRARDVAGRSGVAVSFGEPGGAHALIFDRRTHDLLGENEGRGGGSADLASRIVGSIQARP